MTLTRTTGLFTLTAALLSFSGCFLFNGSDDSGNDIDAGDTGFTEDRSDDNAPVFLDFSVNTAVATNLDQITFTAVLTDPDGIEDLIGGTLKSLGGSSYGAFQTSSSEGAYELSLSWGDLNTVDIIDLALTDQRTFVAEFFDSAGNTASREIALTLECDDERDGTCEGDGQCAPMTDQNACGSCDNDCDVDPPIVPTPGRTELVREPACGYEEDEEEEHFCWTLFSVDGGVGDSCDDVCDTWSCLSAFTVDGDVSCSATSNEQLYCACDRRG